LRKRFYILFVTRDAEGELRKIHIPLQYLYVFLAGTILGMMTITGIAGSYTRMLIKTARFNELRTEKKQLETRYTQLEKTAKDREIQVASLGSLASEISTMYGLKSEPAFAPSAQDITERQVAQSLDQMNLLRRAALRGGAMLGLSGTVRRGVSAMDWLNMASAPSLWPVEGRITSPFGARIDPFGGEGAFHKGVDIAVPYGTPILAPADGVVGFADFESGYGRLIAIEHGQGVTTRYGHLSAFAVTEGQHVQRGEVIGYVGLSGRSTGPHVHYEVWVRGTPVNPYKYLRITSASMRKISSGD
jgi:murein DD-endopeptidase MepM/ murein hydrolase activator NlpD